MICFLGFSILAIVLIEDHGEEALAFFVLGSGSFVHFFFIAWCVETFADIRHYARETAIALTSGKEEKKAEDTKPNASQEQ